MQTRRNFLSLTAMAAVATALPSVATPPTKGKYQVVLLGYNSDSKVVEEDHFFFDSPPTEDLKSDSLTCRFVTCKVYKTIAPRRRVPLFYGYVIADGLYVNKEFNDSIRESIEYDMSFKARGHMDRTVAEFQAARIADFGT
ncbi:MAG: twin-arginine translocation signal domain-containing protein [Hyphomicrobiaceae bacterium]|nr:MAG: twin-arginine translocation signal domain-containing protein [Hyphomicrobiaceae bacterium]